MNKLLSNWAGDKEASFPSGLYRKSVMPEMSVIVAMVICAVENMAMEVNLFSHMSFAWDFDECGEFVRDISTMSHRWDSNNLFYYCWWEQDEKYCDFKPRGQRECMRTCKKLGGYQVKWTSLDRGRSCVVNYKEIQDTVDVFFML